MQTRLLFERFRQRAVSLLQLPEQPHVFRRAIALSPNDADGYEALAEVLAWAGRPEESIASIRQAMRLNPHYPYNYLWTLGHASFMLRNNADAIEQSSTRQGRGGSRGV